MCLELKEKLHETTCTPKLVIQNNWKTQNPDSDQIMEEKDICKCNISLVKLIIIPAVC